MDDAQEAYSQEDEIRGMNVQLGMEGTNSNGHGEEKDDNMNMVETIRNLQKYVQSHKVDNERLMKSKEQQEDFNMKLMKSLDIIENKLDKESGSNKSGSHRTLRKKEDQGVIADITITLKDNPKGENIESQFHPLPGSIRGMGWMN
jgi:hypothetical protein